MDPQTNLQATGPDWRNISEEILCPLCEYDLQGLTEPRCPECGYTFDWPDLVDPTRRMHRYIFEHHPEKNIRSFWQTAAGALRPRRFWRSLQPAQPSSPRRLILYWLLAMLLSYVLFQAVVAGCVYYFDIRPTFARNRAMQPRMIAQFKSLPDTNPNKIELIKTFGTIENGAEQYFPTHLSWNIVQDELHIYSPALTMPFLLVFWPWAMFAILMLFRHSMRRAKIRPIHVLRCCIYTSGTVVWLALAIPFLVLGGAVLYQLGMATLDTLGPIGGWLFVGLLVLMVYQLGTAYRLYLRFDHSFATVICAQVIAILVYLVTVVGIPVILHG